MKGLKKYLNKYGFIGGKLSSIPLDSFQYLFEILFNEIESKQSLLFSSPMQREQKIANILYVVSESDQGLTLFLIIKKLAVLYMLTRKYIQKRKIDQKLLNFLQECINKIVHDDVKIIGESRQKKSSSLGKVYQFIRELSGSKEKTGRTRIEDSSQKGVKGGLNETLSKVIVPFCLYLLKVLQDHQSYKLLVQHSAITAEQDLWKLINWALSLGEIVNKVAKLTRYFTKDFHEVLIFIVFLASKDLASSYDMIKETVQQSAVEFSQIIALRKKNHTDNEFNQRIMSLKRAIEEMLTLKQKLSVIFANRLLVNFLPFFSKPTKYQNYDEPFVRELEIIMAYNDDANMVGNQKARGKERTNQTEAGLDEEETSKSDLFCVQLLKLTDQPRINSNLQQREGGISNLRKVKKIIPVK